MIADIEDNKVNCVVVKDLSRFGRDYIDTGRYLERIFPELNVRFISVTDFFLIERTINKKKRFTPNRLKRWKKRKKKV